MRCTAFFFFLVIVILSCQPNDEPEDPVVKDTISSNAADTVQSKPAVLLIVPGRSIGEVNIGMNSEKLGNLLGKPDSSDAAMGKAWVTWMGRRVEHNLQTELNIYTSYSDSTMQEKTVQLIRTNSPSFFTTDGLRVYDPINQFGTAYNMKYQGHFKHTDGRIISVYDVPGQGIAFEVAMRGEQKRCTAIIVYQKNRSFINIYRSFLNLRGWVSSNTPVNQ